MRTVCVFCSMHICIYASMYMSAHDIRTSLRLLPDLSVCLSLPVSRCVYVCREVDW